MPLQKLVLKPGLNREGTIYSNSGGWFDGDKIRFRSGLPEKIGGWAQLSSNQYNGVCRSLWVWATGDASVGTTFTGAGTNTKYYIYSGGIYYDITPIYQTDTLTNPFSVTNTSFTVTVTDVSYNPSVGDFVTFSGGTAVGGITISGDYQVQSVPSTTTYTITSTVAATSTATGGGTVTAQYEYPSGLAIFSIGTGWGAGPWNAGSSSDAWAHGWGTPYPGVGIGTQLRLWTNDNFGNDLIIAPRGGPIFYWVESGGLASRSQYLKSLANTTTVLTDSSTFNSGVTSITVTSGNAPYIYPYMAITGTGIPANTLVASSYVTGSTTVPITNTTTANSSGTYNFSYAGSFVPSATYQVISSSIQEFVVAFGANPYSPNNANTTFNPLLVRWSDQANPYQWIPIITNQSGEYTLSNGSYIMGARAARQEILVWTDSALYSMQYIGAPYVWGFQLLMDNISIMSPNCMITVNNVTYWMGRDRFYMYDGTVKTLPCALKQYVFDDINQDQAYQVFAGSNEGFNEIWWFYCSIDGNSGTRTAPNTQIDKYVIYNYLENIWYYGTMSRSAWLQNGTSQYPIAADYNGRLLNHEFGVDDNSLSVTQPISAYIQSSDIEISQQDSGQHFGFVWRMLPDVNFNGSTISNPSVNITLLPRQNSGSAYTSADNPQVLSGNNYLNVPEYTVQQFTGQVYTRLRGRQMAFKLSSNQIGVAWQLGITRFDVRADGRR